MTGSVDRDAVVDAVHGAMTVEFASGSDGKPSTFPLTPFWDEQREAVVVTSPPAFAGKVEDAERNPRVAFLADHGDHELLVRGEATVYDTDPVANRRYVRRLIDDQPDGFKKDVFQRSNALIRSPLGWLLLGWYSLRVVVAIEPTATERLERPGRPAVEAWPGAELDAREAAEHERAVFTAMDDEDYPASRPVAAVERDGGEVTGAHAGDDEGGGAATLTLPEPPDVEPGQPACLLLHWHSDDIGDLGQRLVRGRVDDRDGDQVRLAPGSTFSMRNASALDQLAFLVEGKRRTIEYFDGGGPLDWIRY